jgi:2-methylcitrate dehydratase PrpD
MRVSIKPYACCRYNHGLIDCILRIARDNQFEPSDVEHIRLGVLSGGALLVADPIEQKRRPASTVDAQFSAPYAAAVALVYGTGGIDAYSPDKLHDPTVRDLMSRTTCFADPTLDAVYPQQWPAAAEIGLRDGRRLSTRIEFATGEPENPVRREALVEKFVSLAAGSVAEPQALAETILTLDALPDLRSLDIDLGG